LYYEHVFERENKKKRNPSHNILLQNLAKQGKFTDENEAIQDQLLTDIRSRQINIVLFKIDNISNAGVSN